MMDKARFGLEWKDATIGTTCAGGALPADQIVRYWAIPIWPQGYDENGIWQTPSEGAA